MWIVVAAELILVHSFCIKSNWQICKTFKKLYSVILFAQKNTSIYFTIEKTFLFIVHGLELGQACIKSDKKSVRKQSKVDESTDQSVTCWLCTAPGQSLILAINKNQQREREREKMFPRSCHDCLCLCPSV